MSAPPAEGARTAWRDVPPRVRGEIERVCGAPVTWAQTQPGGFSPGTAARVRCADGSRWFVKAASAGVNPETPRLHRQEARVLTALAPLIAARGLPVPRLRGTAEAGPWFALVTADAGGRQPALPWRDEELALALAAASELAGALTPAPAAAPVPGIGERMGTAFTGWRTLAARPPDTRLDPWSRARLSELAALEATWARHAAGGTLLHCDLRADNMLLSGGRVVVVDWPHACRGAAFADLVFLAPSVAMQGGPPPAELLARTQAGRDASPDAVRALVCAAAGYLTQRSLEPPPPGLPTLRAFQAADGEATRRWLAELM